MQTILTVSKTESSSIEEIGNGMSGFRVDLSITDYLNITPKIFVMQREVVSSGNTETYEDQFYTVASVSQLESILEAVTEGIPFYRTDLISLVFRTLEDLRKYTDQILALINRLRLANDLANTMLASTVIGFPAEASSRFWGSTSETTITDAILLAGESDTVYSNELSKTISVTVGPKYLYFATRASLAAIEEMSANGADKAFSSTTRNVEVLDGFNVSYRIYRTTSTVSASSSILFEAA